MWGVEAARTMPVYRTKWRRVASVPIRQMESCHPVSHLTLQLRRFDNQMPCNDRWRVAAYVRLFSALWWLLMSLRQYSAWHCHALASLHCNVNRNWNVLLTASKNYVGSGEVYEESHFSFVCLSGVIWFQPWRVVLKIAPLEQLMVSCSCTDVFYWKKRI